MWQSIKKCTTGTLTSARHSGQVFGIKSIPFQTLIRKTLIVDLNFFNSTRYLNISSKLILINSLSFVWLFEGGSFLWSSVWSIRERSFCSKRFHFFVGTLMKNKLVLSFNNKEEWQEAWNLSEVDIFNVFQTLKSGSISWALEEIFLELKRSILCRFNRAIIRSILFQDHQHKKDFEFLHYLKI